MPSIRRSDERGSAFHGWPHVAKGAAEVNGSTLAAGGAASTSDAEMLTITATEDAELLLFDLA